MIWGKFGKKSLRFLKTPIERDARINIMDGAVRSGKTVTMIPRWIKYITSGPAGRLIMTGVTKQTIKSNVLNDLFDTVGERNYSYNRSTGELKIYRREIQVVGAKDEGSEKYLRGQTYAGAYCDEVSTMPQAFFSQLLNRLSVEGSKLYGTTNPDSPYHYLHVDYLTNPERLKSGMVKRIQFELDDNPNLSEEYKGFIRTAYAGLMYRRMILGQWVLAEGAIYEMYDAQKHEVTRAELPKFFDKKIIGIDYGASNPTVFLKIGVTFRDRKPVFWEYQEYYHDPQSMGAKTNAQYKRDLVKFMAKDQKPGPVDRIYMDPSAASFFTELLSTSEGGPIRNVVAADNSVLSGINSVATAMEDGRYFVVKADCPNSCKESVAYIWDPDAQKRGEDAPLKDHDHAKDAERYAIHTAFPASNLERLYSACR